MRWFLLIAMSTYLGLHRNTGNEPIHVVNVSLNDDHQMLKCYNIPILIEIEHMSGAKKLEVIFD